MWISRMRVTGGFLNGLDISFARGLNVVIGPRGAGKTTLLELLRLAVGAERVEQSRDSKRKRKTFYDAILGIGEVKLDIELEGGGRHIVVDAKGGGQRADLANKVLSLGQNELEEIASDADSRLNLLDLRTGTTVDIVDRSQAAEITGEIFDVRLELEHRLEEAEKRSSLLEDRALLLSQETALIGDNADQIAEQRQALRDAEEQVITTGRDLDVVANIQVGVNIVLNETQHMHQRLLGLSSEVSKLSDVEDLQALLNTAKELSEQLQGAIRATPEMLTSVMGHIREKNIHAREKAAPIREDLEKAEAGLGQITAQLRNVDTALRALDENESHIANLQSRLADLADRRSLLLDEAEQSEESVFKMRLEIARETTSQISNNVVVEVEHLADSSDFSQYLRDSLKGTNTRTALIDKVAENVLPRQLLEMVENDDTTGLAAVTEIDADRAQRLLANLRELDILKGLTCVVLSDKVDFRLRDGSTDKSVDQLSTGQKCAVTLPIVLSEPERILVLDQPEDHLDNAFLVSNIIAGINSRTGNSAQTIIATHNANIPVLGSADKVIVLNSDGRAGGVDVEGPYNSDDIVERITGLMEGGRDAFARRSAFYAKHGGVE